MLKPTPASELRNVLAESVKRFKFVKLNGELREALGTRDIKLIPKDVRTPKFIDDVSEKSIVYWDLDEQDFRSVSTKSFVGIY
jgi:WYL_2, Sm-like SH3 beta-barrel fold